MRSASPRVAQPNWSGPGTAQIAYEGVSSDSLLWITTSPVSGMLSDMVASRKTVIVVPLIRPAAVQDDLERGRLGGVSEGVVGLHDVVETESMRDQPCGTKLPGLHQSEK